MGIDLNDMFREAYGQSLTPPNVMPEKKRREIEKRKPVSEKYQDFLRKYADLEKYIESFKPMDLMYYFREKSRETGNHYRISNMKRDMGIFKMLLDDYDPVDICAMIEFLFESGQKYLPTDVLQPTVLNSSWCNKVYGDTEDWVAGKFDPNADSKKKQRKLSPAGAERNSQREWKKSGKKKVKIGDWGDE